MATGCKRHDLLVAFLIVTCLAQIADSVICQDDTHPYGQCCGDACAVQILYTNGQAEAYYAGCVTGASVGSIAEGCTDYDTTSVCLCTADYCSSNSTYWATHKQSQAALSCGSDADGQCRSCAATQVGYAMNETCFYEEQYEMPEKLLVDGSCMELITGEQPELICRCNNAQNCAPRLMEAQRNLSSSQVSCLRGLNGSATCSGQLCFVHSDGTRGCLTNNETLHPGLFRVGLVQYLYRSIIFCNTTGCNVDWHTAMKLTNSYEEECAFTDHTAEPTTQSSSETDEDEQALHRIKDPFMSLQLMQEQPPFQEGTTEAVDYPSDFTESQDQDQDQDPWTGDTTTAAGLAGTGGSIVPIPEIFVVLGGVAAGAGSPTTRPGPVQVPAGPVRVTGGGGTFGTRKWAVTAAAPTPEPDPGVPPPVPTREPFASRVFIATAPGPIVVLRGPTLPPTKKTTPEQKTTESAPPSNAFSTIPYYPDYGEFGPLDNIESNSTEPSNSTMVVVRDDIAWPKHMGYTIEPSTTETPNDTVVVVEDDLAWPKHMGYTVEPSTTEPPNDTVVLVEDDRAWPKHMGYTMEPSTSESPNDTVVVVGDDFAWPKHMGYTIELSTTESPNETLVVTGDDIAWPEDMSATIEYVIDAETPPPQKVEVVHWNNETFETTPYYYEDATWPTTPPSNDDEEMADAAFWESQLLPLDSLIPGESTTWETPPTREIIYWADDSGDSLGETVGTDTTEWTTYGTPNNEDDYDPNAGSPEYFGASNDYYWNGWGNVYWDGWDWGWVWDGDESSNSSPTYEYYEYADERSTSSPTYEYYEYADERSTSSPTYEYYDYEQASSTSAPDYYAEYYEDYEEASTTIGGPVAQDGGPWNGGNGWGPVDPVGRSASTSGGWWDYVDSRNQPRANTGSNGEATGPSGPTEDTTWGWTGTWWAGTHNTEEPTTERATTVRQPRILRQPAGVGGAFIQQAEITTTIETPEVPQLGNSVEPNILQKFRNSWDSMVGTVRQFFR